MKTKQRIISKAVQYYNKYGVTNVTSRDLAKSLGMSHGNLEYHFKNKEALLYAIYLEMRKEISGVYEEKLISHDPYLHFHELLETLKEFHDKYAFFNRDILEIARNFETIGALFHDTLQIRKEQTRSFFKAFIAHGYFKEEPRKGMYARLQHSIRILITFWKAQETVLTNIYSTQEANMVVYIWELLLNHMTKKGLDKFNLEILPKLEKYSEYDR
ncbi:TetR/AcrR family transcriptional regulator [Flagellimonas sp. 2504JD4-2]